VQVNKQLREKARSSQTALQHATSGGSSEEGDSAGAASAVPDDPTTEKVLTTLRAAKSMLKLRDSTGAKAQFEQALALVQQHEASLESPWKAKRKALRGLGAACQQLGDHDAALRHLQQVLYISEEHGLELVDLLDRENRDDEIVVLKLEDRVRIVEQDVRVEDVVLLHRCVSRRDTSNGPTDRKRRRAGCTSA
jgi:tetratricopeptide (TPR) repeat protein